MKTPRRRRRDIADALSPAGEQGAGALRREEAAHDAHAEDDKRQQHQDFRRVEHEEAGGLLEMRAGWNREAGDDPGRERFQTPVDREPERDGGERARYPRRGRGRARSRLGESPALMPPSAEARKRSPSRRRRSPGVAGGRSAESR